MLSESELKDLWRNSPAFDEKEPKDQPSFSDAQRYLKEAEDSVKNKNIGEEEKEKAYVKTIVLRRLGYRSLSNKAFYTIVKNAPKDKDDKKPTLKDAKKYWKQAENMAKKKGLKFGSKEYWNYSMKIFRNKLGYKSEEIKSSLKSYYNTSSVDDEDSLILEFLKELN